MTGNRESLAGRIISNRRPKRDCRVLAGCFEEVPRTVYIVGKNLLDQESAAQRGRDGLPYATNILRRKRATCYI